MPRMPTTFLDHERSDGLVTSLSLPLLPQLLPSNARVLRSTHLLKPCTSPPPPPPPPNPIATLTHAQTPTQPSPLSPLRLFPYAPPPPPLQDETYYYNFDLAVPGEDSSEDLSVSSAPPSSAEAFICDESQPTSSSKGDDDVELAEPSPTPVWYTCVLYVYYRPYALQPQREQFLPARMASAVYPPTTTPWAPTTAFKHQNFPYETG